MIKEKTPEKKKLQDKKSTILDEDVIDDGDEENDSDFTYNENDVTDEESVASVSDTGTPHSSKPNTESKTVSPFKKPYDATFSAAVRSLDFDAIGMDDNNEKLLRSKANLKDINIEELESRLAPPHVTDLPDMTPDVYFDFDNFDEDYLTAAMMLPPAIDEENDPDEEEEEFEEELVEESSIQDLLNDEFKFNKSTKISQKEADLLLEEVFDAYDLDQKDKQKRRTKSSMKTSNSNDQVQEPAQKMPKGTSYYPEEYLPSYCLNSNERAIVAQQMRQHIQLLSQMALLTSKDDQWLDLNKDCRYMISDIVTKSFSIPYSIYAQDNLFPSNQMLQDWDKMNCNVTEKKPGNKNYALSEELVQFMAERPVFIYPKMLPICPLKLKSKKNPLEPEKPYFAKAEDNLIVLGLEYFFGGTDKWKNGKQLTEACTSVVANMLKSKSVKHVRYRIKNRKDPLKCKGENAIKFYFKNNYAPREAYNDLETYNPSKIVSPKNADPNDLPQLWREKLKKSLAPNTVPLPPISIKTTESETVPSYSVS